MSVNKRYPRTCVTKSLDWGSI